MKCFFKDDRQLTILLVYLKKKSSTPLMGQIFDQTNSILVIEDDLAILEWFTKHNLKRLFYPAAISHLSCAFDIRKFMVYLSFNL